MKVYFKDKKELTSNNLAIITIIILYIHVLFGFILINFFEIFSLKLYLDLLIIILFISVFILVIKINIYYRNKYSNNVSKEYFLEISETEIKILNPKIKFHNLKKENLTNIILVNYYNRLKSFPISVNDRIIFKLKSGEELIFKKNEAYVGKIYDSLEEMNYTNLLKIEDRFGYGSF